MSVSDGTVMAWGNNQHGQLGDGSLEPVENAPVQVSGLTNITAVSCGADHSLALLSDGTVMAWGDNSLGQLGDGTLTSRNTPAQVPGLTTVIAIAGGSAQSFALLADGTVMAWGYNGFGQLGTTSNDSTRPAPVSNLANVTSIASAGEHTLALLADGTVMSWGTKRFFSGVAVHTSTEKKICRGEDVPVGLQELLPRRSLLSLGSRLDSVLPQDGGDGPATDVMAQIPERALDPETARHITRVIMRYVTHNSSYDVVSDRQLSRQANG